MSFVSTNTDINNFRESIIPTNKYEHLGNSTGNFTLKKNIITTVHITGNHILTLPTITDTSQQVTCILDFTTTNSGYPSISNSNIKLKDSASLSYSTYTGTSQNVTGATNASPIEITIATHGYETGDVVTIASVGGNTNANGTFTITKTGANTFTLNGSSGNGTYTTGGAAVVYITRNRLIFTSINGSDNWEVKLEKYGGVTQTFTRPNLSADGTLGGVSFAVSSSTITAPNYAWNSVDGSADTQVYLNTVPGYVILYNPNYLKVSSFNIKNYSVGANGAYAATSGEVLGSNDGSSFTSLYSYTNTITTGGGTWDIPVNSSNYYKYYKITANTSAYVATIFAEIGVTALELLV